MKYTMTLNLQKMTAKQEINRSHFKLQVVPCNNHVSSNITILIEGTHFCFQGYTQFLSCLQKINIARDREDGIKISYWNAFKAAGWHGFEILIAQNYDTELNYACCNSSSFHADFLLCFWWEIKNYTYLIFPLLMAEILN